MLRAIVGAAALAATATGEIYFQESFNDGAAWESRWVQSVSKPADQRGALKLTHGQFNGGEANDDGVHTSQDARFYQWSAKMDKDFNNEGKDLVVQYTVKHEQKLDCGGAYIKLHPKNLDQSQFNGDSPYAVMFGPDVCGGGTRKTHAILSYEKDGTSTNLENEKKIRVETDTLSHMYTFVLSKDNTYEVLIDGNSATKGTLEADWKFLPPKEIKDPAVSKPADWVDEKNIPDPTDVKPEGYDDIPPSIPDPEASTPDDWDVEDDGEWEAPTIPNPDYSGPWKARMIPNPAYKGEWVHPLIANPDYDASAAASLYHRCVDCAYVGFELWQVKSGTVFDDILVSDSVEEARLHGERNFFKKRDEEKRQFDEAEKARRERERLAREEEAAKRKAEEEAAAAAEEEAAAAAETEGGAHEEL